MTSMPHCHVASQVLFSDRDVVPGRVGDKVQGPIAWGQALRFACTIGWALLEPYCTLVFVCLVHHMSGHQSACTVMPCDWGRPGFAHATGALWQPGTFTARHSQQNPHCCAHCRSMEEQSALHASRNGRLWGRVQKLPCSETLTRAATPAQL